MVFALFRSNRFLYWCVQFLSKFIIMSKTLMVSSVLDISVTQIIETLLKLHPQDWYFVQFRTSVVKCIIFSEKLTTCRHQNAGHYMHAMVKWKSRNTFYSTFYAHLGCSLCAVCAISFWPKSCEICAGCLREEKLTGCHPTA